MKRTWKKKANMETKSAFRYHIMNAQYHIRLASFERRCGRHISAVKQLEEARYYRRQAMEIVNEFKA